MLEEIIRRYIENEFNKSTGTLFRNTWRGAGFVGGNFQEIDNIHYIIKTLIVEDDVFSRNAIIEMERYRNRLLGAMIKTF